MAIVGTRQATDYGREQTEAPRAGPAAAPARWSSAAWLMASTSLAHRAALQEGLATVGVMATGLDIIYPAAHRKTAEKMREAGGLLTGFPSARRPTATTSRPATASSPAWPTARWWWKPPAKGGALITAELALSYDRDVLAVPGNASAAAASAGCNDLIQNNKAALYAEPA
ncbi:MAG: DNA-processing protein DprA [Hymenobacter sp.]